MKTNINMSMNGAFRAQIYSGGKLVEDTDFFSNFITPTGLYYPNIYPFVDCFRFLSLGSNFSIANSGGRVTGIGFTGSSVGTTGLSTPINTFNTSFGIQTGTYIGWQGYENGSDNSQSACGTLLTEQGPRFYRAWAIPTGGVDHTVQNGGAGLVINEFMVSPSSGNDPTGCCAFSRVRRTVTIPDGHSAIISYQLSVNIQNTGLAYFPPGTFTTGNADVTSNPSEDLGIISGWGQLSGYYRHVYHGLNVIDSAGAHFTPQYGCGMEPYLTDLSDYCFYLSPDNSAFDVSNTGYIQNNSSNAYAADGLMATLFGIPMTAQIASDNLSDDFFYGIPPLANLVDGNSQISTPGNIRIGVDGSQLNVPNLENYASGETRDTSFHYQKTNDSSLQDVSYATPGILGFNNSKVNFKQKAIFSTRIFKQPMDFNIAQNTISGRTKTITRKTLFSPVSSLGYNSRFGSLIFAFHVPDTVTPNAFYYPYVDTLFFNSSGRSLMQHYRLINVVLDNRGTGIADSYITISQSGNFNHNENINRFYSRKTFQGPYDIIDGNITGFDVTNSLISSTFYTDENGNQIFTLVPLSGFADSNNQNGEAVQTAINNGRALITSGCSGWGMVYGVVGDQYTYFEKEMDCGLVDHNIISGVNGLQITSPPSITGSLYWPDKTKPLMLNITGIKYFSTGSCFGGNSYPLTSGSQGDGSNYNWSTNLCNFCPPTGHIEHYENIGVEGFRLLPNHGIPNNQGINTYDALTGGYFPATSFNNGIELYFSISWSSPCGDSINCL